MFRFCLFALSLVAYVAVGAQQWQVGAATLSINPGKDSLYLAGGKPNRKFIGVHDTLYVKAVVISNHSTSIALLTYDCIGLMYPQLLAIREQVRMALPELPATHIVLSSTHTHAGADVVGLWGSDLMHSGVNDAYLDTVISRSVRVLARAWHTRMPAKAMYGVGQHGQNWVFNISEPAEIDRTLTAIRFADFKGRNIATLVNFACHPTVMNDATTEGSADYVGGYYRYADSVQGGTNLFLQGAIGGWVQPEGLPAHFDTAMYYGKKLAAQALGQLEKGTELKADQLLFKRKMLELPVANQGFRMLARAGVIKRNFKETVPTEIAYFQVGQAAFITHPGETPPALSLQCRKWIGQQPVVVMGLAMDALGYILKPSFFEPGNTIAHSKYLTSMSLGPQTLPLLEMAIQALIQQ